MLARRFPWFTLSLATLGVVATTGCQSRTWQQITETETRNGSARASAEYEYDSNGRMTELRLDDVFVSYEIDITYNDDGIDTIEAAGIDQVIEFEYDSGRVAERRTTTGEVTTVTSYDYTDTGDIKEIASLDGDGEPNSTIAFSYDDTGRLAERTQTYEGTDTGYRWEYEYDDRGLLDEINLFAFSSESDTSIGDVDLTYEDGRVVEVEDNNDEIEVEYNDDGLIEQLDYQDEDISVDVTYGEGPSSAFHAPIPGNEFNFFIDHAGQPGGFDTDSIYFYLLQ